MIEYTVRTNSSGTTEWRVGDKLHRENGPAIEYADGTKEYYLNGQRHRKDGPAVEFAHGYCAYYLHGVPYSEAEYKKEANKGVKYTGVIIRVSYIAVKPENDYVTVLDNENQQHGCYRFQVTEIVERSRWGPGEHFPRIDV